MSRTWTLTYNDYDCLARINGFLTKKEVENVDETNTRVTTNQYDGNGNLTQVTLPEGNKIQSTYDERDLLASGWLCPYCFETFVTPKEAI